MPWQRWVALFCLLSLSCAGSDTTERPEDAADAYAVAWPAAADGFTAAGGWRAEHRWDERVGNLSYEEGYHAWVRTISSTEVIQIAAPPGARATNNDLVIVPELDCADFAMALRFVFAATHRLSFRVESTQGGPTVTEAGFSDLASHATLGRSAVTEFFSRMGLSTATATLGSKILAAFASVDLASDTNTYLTGFGYAASGDLVSDASHTRVIGRLTRDAQDRYDVRIVQGLPGQRPEWSPTSGADFLIGILEGNGPRRFRTESTSPVTHARETSVEFQAWTDHFATSVQQAYEIAIARYASRLNDYLPTSCHSRTRLLNLLIRHYHHTSEGIDWEDYLRTFPYDGDLPSVLVEFPEFAYEQSPTCAWNPGEEEAQTLVMQKNTVPEPRPAFRMVNGHYPEHIEAVASWRNDEGRTFRVMTDVLSRRACDFITLTPYRIALGCTGVVPSRPPALQ